MSRSDLERVANAMVAKDKGLLAADESNTTIAKRLDKIGCQSTEEHRRTYRELLFTTPGITQWISGVILYDETIRQKTADGVLFPDYLAKLGVIPGIKVDTGAKPLAGYAALCQEQNIVPIVEPEVLMDGGHTLERCDAVTSGVLAEVFAQLDRQRIHLGGMILKPNMVIWAKQC